MDGRPEGGGVWLIHVPCLEETLVGGRLLSARSEIQTSSLLSFAALLRPSIFQSSLPRRARPAPAPLFGSKLYSIKRPHVSLPVAHSRTRTYRLSFLSRLVLLTARAPFRRPDKPSVHRRQANAKSHHRQDWVRHREKSEPCSQRRRAPATHQPSEPLQPRRHLLLSLADSELTKEKVRIIVLLCSKARTDCAHE